MQVRPVTAVKQRPTFSNGSALPFGKQRFFMGIETPDFTLVSGGTT